MVVAFAVAGALFPAGLRSTGGFNGHEAAAHDLAARRDLKGIGRVGAYINRCVEFKLVILASCERPAGHVKCLAADVTINQRAVCKRGYFNKPQIKQVVHTVAGVNGEVRGNRWSDPYGE